VVFLRGRLRYLTSYEDGKVIIGSAAGEEKTGMMALPMTKSHVGLL